MRFSAALIGIGFVWTRRSSYDGAISASSARAPSAVAVAVEADHLGDLVPPEMGRDRDDADGAEPEEGQRVRVISGVEVEPGLLRDEARLVEVVVRLLHGDDRVDLREPRDRDRLDVDDHAARDVVRDDRQVGSGRDRLEVLDDRPLRRLVVVRRHDEDAVHAERRRLLREMDGMRGVVRAGAGDDGRALADGLARGREEEELLLVAQRRRLAGRAADDDAVRAIVDEIRREVAEAVDVDRAVRLNGVTIAVRTEPSTRK